MFKKMGNIGNIGNRYRLIRSEGIFDKRSVTNKKKAKHFCLADLHLVLFTKAYFFFGVTFFFAVFLAMLILLSKRNFDIIV